MPILQPGEIETGLIQRGQSLIVTGHAAVRIGMVDNTVTARTSFGPYQLDMPYAVHAVGTTTTTMMSGRFASTVPSMSWGELPPPGVSHFGLVHIHDVGVGGSMWYSDGARWRPVSRQIVLHSIVSDAGIFYADGGSEALVDAAVRIPGGVIRPGDSLRFTAAFAHPTIGSAARSLRYRIAATPDGLAAGADVAAMVYTSSSNINVMTDKVTAVTSTTGLRRGTNAQPGAYFGPGALVDATIPSLTEDTWIGLYAWPGADTSILLYQAALTLEVGQ